MNGVVMPGRWDYHLHTTFSDGEDSMESMAAKALALELDGVCFCDHCRKTSDWLGEYKGAVERLRAEYAGRLDILCAVEAKVIDHSGNIDIPDGLPDDILCVAAIHRIPDGQGGFIRASEIDPAAPERALECWRAAVSGLAGNPRVSRLAHPFSLLGRLGITQTSTDFWEWLSETFASGSYLLENNVRYEASFVPPWFVERFAGRMLPASDSHSTAALEGAFARLYPLDK